MQIDIGEYRLNRFEESWCIRRKYVVKKGKMAGDVLWKEPQYYYKLEHALSNLLNRMVREHNEESTEEVEDMLQVVQACTNQILDAVRELQQIKDGIFA